MAARFVGRTTEIVTLEEEADRAPMADVEALARAAYAQRALIVADNVEQLDADARDALGRIPVLAAAATSTANAERTSPLGGPRVLATSRELLGAPDEVAVEVAPLDEEEAFALFVEIAGMKPDADVREGADARAIVRRLDALPLAIELAAARAPVLGVAGLLARLDRKLDLLGGVAVDKVPRHATLRATIAWSWELLDERDREALIACATFEGPFDTDLVETVIGGDETHILDCLERLRARALIHAMTNAQGRTTLRLLESVRDYAREAGSAAAELSPPASRGSPVRSTSPPEGDAWSRHDAAVVARAEPLAEDARCGRDTLAELEALRADLGAAARRTTLWSSRAALALSALLAIAGPATSALELLERVSAPGESHTFLAVCVAKGEALRALGRLDEARDHKVAYAGSINLSFTSLTKNREVGLLVTEPTNIDAMHSTFEKDWATATPF